MAAEPDFRALFEGMPGLCLVLTPDFRIAAVTDQYLQATMTERAAILGKGIFDVFPDNPDDPSATGAKNLRESLERVLRNRAPDAMAVQKYDIRRPASEGGAFEERYWSPFNAPVFAPDGRLTYIIHRAEDVTEFVRLKLRGQEQEALTEELRRRAERMEAEVYLRARQLQEFNQELEKANAALEAEVLQRQRGREHPRERAAVSHDGRNDPGHGGDLPGDRPRLRQRDGRENARLHAGRTRQP